MVFFQKTIWRLSLRVSLKRDGLELVLLDYSVWDILQELVYEGRCGPFANLKDLQNVMLSETNGMMSTIRQSEKLYYSGKGV